MTLVAGSECGEQSDSGDDARDRQRDHAESRQGRTVRDEGRYVGRVDVGGVYRGATGDDQFGPVRDDDRQLQEAFEGGSDQRNVGRAADGDDGVGIELGLESESAHRLGGLFGGACNGQLEDVPFEEYVLAIGCAGGQVRGQRFLDSTAEGRQCTVFVGRLGRTHYAESEYVVTDHCVEGGTAHGGGPRGTVGAAGFDVHDVDVDSGLARVEQRDRSVVGGEARAQVLHGRAGPVDEVDVGDVLLGQRVGDSGAFDGGSVGDAE
ncbi:hypothetical protein CH251_04045 [Rhodococcus sp. 06-462-5]|nr:hypothetical protein CH251_04045 [Rhodococcus sp. 06-462-5]